MSSNITNFSVVLTENENTPAGGVQLKSKFFTASKASGEVQPTVVIDSQIGGNDYIVQCNMNKVVHGTMTKGGPPAMLAVFEFIFLPRGATKRFLAAEIEIEFSEGQLAKIAPEGVFVTSKSETEREVTHTVSPSVEIGIDPVKTALGYTWELKETSSIVGYASLKGVRRHEKKRALWILSENRQTASGLPSLLRTAVLLGRNPRPTGVPDTFTATVQIRGEVKKLMDVKGKLELVKRDLSSRCRENEIISFNSALSRGDVMDASNMQNEKLDAYPALVTVKAWEESEQATSPCGQIQHSSTTGAQPSTGTIGTPKHIDCQPETIQLTESEPASRLGTSPPSVTPAASDPLHESLSTLVVDNTPASQAVPTHVYDSYNPLGPQPSIAAAIVSPVTGMVENDYKNAAENTDILDQPQAGPPTTRDLPKSQTADDTLAALQQQLSSVRTEAQLVHRLLNLVEQERFLLREIRKSEVSGLGSG